MNKQAAQIKTVQSDMASQSKVVKELQSEVRTLVTALREQTDLENYRAISIMMSFLVKFTLFCQDQYAINAK